MKILLISLLFAGFSAFAQTPDENSPIDMLSYGVILDDPAMKSVVIKKDVRYIEDAKGNLHIDIYMPPNLKAGEKRPAIIFFNSIGDNGPNKVKSWGIYRTWPQLMAAQGYIGISMENDASRIQEALQGLFKFLDDKGVAYNIDKDRLGVYAASANVTQSTQYLMSKEAAKGIKAAVLYYGRPPVGPFRKDLPVLFLVSEGDMNAGYNGIWSEVIKNNAPWTLKMGTGMPHAFDAVSDNDEARKLVRETISFWKNHLDPVPAPAFKHSTGRDILGSLQMDRPKAMSLLNSLMKEHPDNIPTLLFYANELRRDKKTVEATEVYKKVLTKQPDNMEALIAMAANSFAQDKTEEGETYIAKAVKTGKVTRNDYSRLAFNLLVANKNKEAAHYFEKAIAISPSNFDSYNLACAYAKINDVDNALRALDYAVKHGYGTKQQIDNDTDFDLIRSNEKFRQLVSSIQ